MRLTLAPWASADFCPKLKPHCIVLSGTATPLASPCRRFVALRCSLGSIMYGPCISRPGLTSRRHLLFDNTGSQRSAALSLGLLRLLVFHQHISEGAARRWRRRFREHVYGAIRASASWASNGLLSHSKTANTAHLASNCHCGEAISLKYRHSQV